MMPAPTNDMANGMKMRIFRYFSPRALSMNTAYARPMTVANVGATSTQMIVLMTDQKPSGLVKVQT